MKKRKIVTDLQQRWLLYFALAAVQSNAIYVRLFAI